MRLGDSQRGRLWGIVLAAGEGNRLMGYVESADRAVQAHPERPVLLGIRAEDPEIEYGWIEPAESIAPHPGSEVRRVRRFLEKPDFSSACAFFRKGYLWNTFVTVAKAKTLVEMTKNSLHNIWNALSGCGRPSAPSASLP